MLRSVTFKWMATLLVTSLVGVGLVGAVAWVGTTTAFTQLRIDEDTRELTENIIEDYQVNGSLDGVTPRTIGDRSAPPPNTRPGPSNPPRQGQGNDERGGGPNQPGNNAPAYTLVDPDGNVIWADPGGRYRSSMNVTNADFRRGTPISVEDGIIGYLIRSGNTPQLNENEAAYLRTTAQAVMIGAGGASLFAIIVSIILAGHFTRPLRELTQAIREMRGGNLAQAVKVRTRDELGELTEAFNAMSTELHQSNQLRKQMTADIAHDLRTPLTIIAGYLEGLRDGTLQPTEARLATMHNETTQLKHLIEDLRTLSMADAGELRLRTQAVDPDALIHDVASAFEGLAEDNGITLAVHSDDKLPAVVIDPERMTQVFANLVSNAIRHTPTAGTITLSAQAGPHSVIFAVTDSGEGIPADKLPYIFERFYRSDGSRHQTAGETGLGLAIARSIVEAHGGSIQAQSKLGQGTRMSIRLPLHISPA